MTCEEFQIASLDFGFESQATAPGQAAGDHARECPQCAAFQRSWLDLRTDLHAVAAETGSVEAPPRVEMRLRQEFRIQHESWKPRRTAQISAWALAAAAVLVGTIGWVNWRNEKNIAVAANHPVSSKAVDYTAGRSSAVAPAGAEMGEVLVAANDSGDFTLLPGSMPGFLGDATVVHVQMERAALGALGLTVNEEHAGDWIQVDLLLGDDGQPQAVRLPESAN